jgi:hypothetical protein
METYKAPKSVRVLGIGSVALALLGGALYWWTPMGMVLSLAGLLAGLIGWAYARPGTAGIRLVVAGLLLSAAALTLDYVIAGMGLELIRFHALR